MTDKRVHDVPLFRRKKIGDKVLVSNDLGGWAMLSREDFNSFTHPDLHKNPKLFDKLVAAGLIISYESTKDIRQKVSKKLWYLYNGPSLHVIAVTNQCNLGCKYCYASTSDAQHMSPEIAEKVANFVFQSPARRVIVEFSGGEPLLNFDAIKRLVEVSTKLSKEKNKEVGFSIINNGTQWDDEKMKFFIDNDIGVCFSLDGPKELHDTHRKYLGGGGTYDDVSKWLKKFMKKKYPHLNAMPVITKYSLPKWKEVVDEYVSMGFKRIRFKYLGYFGRASEIWDELGYSPEEFIEIWKKVMEYIFELNNQGTDFKEGMAEIIAKKIYSDTDPGYCELQMPCGAGIGQLAYSPDGSIYTCDEGRMFEDFKVGTVDQDLSKILTNNTVKGMVVASSGFANICDNCALKPFCGSCPLESYKQAGDIVSKLPLDRRCKIHGKMIEFLLQRASEDPKVEKLLKAWAKPPEK